MPDGTTSTFASELIPNGGYDLAFDIAAQLKRKGLSEEKLSKEKNYLRLISWTRKVISWDDSNTADLYASLRQVIALRGEPWRDIRWLGSR